MIYKDIKISLPEDVEYILNKLNDNGYEAYVVGGCVRDSLLNRQIHDWDITTNATTEEVNKLFDKTIPTGIKHGTITVMINSIGYEITTYRIDKKTDGRHAEVEFTNSLKEDLSRRDFTINAMAYNDNVGLVDYFHGREDLKLKRIKFVGDANKRIQEDYLRILRAIRFSKQLGFSIGECDFKCISKNIDKINNYVSKERIRDEFNKIIVNLDNDDFYNDCIDIILDIVGLEFITDISQYNHYHIYNVLQHTLVSMRCVDTLELKLAMLLHDTGKYQCKTTDENGINHFYGHAKVSKEIAEKWLDKYKYDNKTKKIVTTLVEYHDITFTPTKKFIKKMLNKFGEDMLRKLIAVKKADILAQNPKFTLERLKKVFTIEEILEEIIKDNECFKLKDLAVNGYDLIEIGFKGKEIGYYLKYLLHAVINGTIDNNRDELISKLKVIYNNRHK